MEHYLPVKIHSLNVEHSKTTGEKSTTIKLTTLSPLNDNSIHNEFIVNVGSLHVPYYTITDMLHSLADNIEQTYIQLICKEVHKHELYKILVKRGICSLPLTDNERKHTYYINEKVIVRTKYDPLIRYKNTLNFSVLNKLFVKNCTSKLHTVDNIGEFPSSIQKAIKDIDTTILPNLRICTNADKALLYFTFKYGDGLLSNSNCFIDFTKMHIG